MKKYLAVVLVLIIVLAFAACGQQTEFEIGITIPAHTTKDFVHPEDFIFSEEEISPEGGKIIITAGKGLGDTQVVLMPVDVKEENAYEPTYLTPGMPVEMKAEKGGWFKIGVAVNNDSDEDTTVYVNVKGVAVRVE